MFVRDPHWWHPGEMVRMTKKDSGMSENGVYSHLVGIMISKTIGCRSTLFSDKPRWLVRSIGGSIVG